MTINEFLIKKISVSGKKAIELILEKKVLVNTLPAIQQQLVSNRDEIEVQGEIIQQPFDYFYIAYYKPRGIECTMNREIPDNLAQALPDLHDFFPVGRLDKDSEGLLILTNDGALYKKIAPSEAFKEKEYLVTVDKLLTEETLRFFSEGVAILGKKTRPSLVTLVDSFTFRIVLTQGLNRQIRRMCYKAGYNVLALKRIRIMSLLLEGLSPGAYRNILREDI